MPAKEIYRAMESDKTIGEDLEKLIQAYEKGDRSIIMKIGVIGFQGDVQEHINSLRSVLQPSGGTVTLIKKTEDLDGISGLVIPGGESTTIFKLISMYGIYDRIVRMGQSS